MAAISIPLPPDFKCWVWFGLGINFARAFAKRLDQQIQATKWFRRRHPIIKWLIRRLLDATHHWWIGALLMIYFADIPEVYWFGCGLLIDDLPDIPRRAKELIKEFKRLARGR